MLGSHGGDAADAGNSMSMSSGLGDWEANLKLEVEESMLLWRLDSVEGFCMTG